MDSDSDSDSDEDDEDAEGKEIDGAGSPTVGGVAPTGGDDAEDAEMDEE